MDIESFTPIIAAIGVAIGLSILIIGVAVHGTEVLRSVGGVIVLLSIGLLAVFLTKLEATPE